MKTITSFRPFLLIAFLFTGWYAQAQSIPVNEPNRHKPQFFADKAPTADCDIDCLTDLFNCSKGQQVSLLLTHDLQFQGKIVSKVELDSTRTSLVLTSQNYTGYILSLTRRLDENGQYLYTGRMINIQYGDCFELVTKNNQPQLLKKNYYDLVNE